MAALILGKAVGPQTPEHLWGGGNRKNVKKGIKSDIVLWRDTGFAVLSEPVHVTGTFHEHGLDMAQWLILQQSSEIFMETHRSLPELATVCRFDQQRLVRNTESQLKAN